MVKEDCRTILFSPPHHHHNETMSDPSSSWRDLQLGPLEITWMILLCGSICVINSFILWVVRTSHNLWNPCHVSMACHSVVNLIMGCYGIMQLLIGTLPGLHGNFFCSFMRVTWAVPYLIHHVFLTFLCLNRFVAVRFPYFYAGVLTNNHVAYCPSINKKSMVIIGLFVSLGIGCLATTIFSALSPSSSSTLCLPSLSQLISMPTLLLIFAVLISILNWLVLKMCNRQIQAINSSMYNLAYLSTQQVESINPPPNFVTGQSRMMRRASSLPRLPMLRETMGPVAPVMRSSYGSTENSLETISESQSPPQISLAVSNSANVSVEEPPLPPPPPPPPPTSAEPRASVERAVRGFGQKRKNVVHLSQVILWLFLIPLLILVNVLIFGGCHGDNDVEKKFVDEMDKKCQMVWTTLQIYLRSFVPIHAFLEAIIYVVSSKEFGHALRGQLRRWRATATFD